MIIAFIDNRDLIDSDIRDLLVLVTKIKDALLHVDDIAAKRCIRAARDIDLLA